MIAYRPEIDGLRAIAVVPIVLFHAGLDWLSGGYIGVDIFFVISGYLIGSIILGDLARGEFSFSDFYRRRMRRILPALLFTVAGTLVCGYFFLLPQEWMDSAQSAIAALFFIPNIKFWLASSTYFGLDIATQPLLHTWSLGVEEQFYLVVPALLVLLSRYCRDAALPGFLVLLCAASFWINLHWMEIDSKFAFYMLPARAWELFAGVLLAWWLPRHVPGCRVGAWLALVGVLLCLAPMFLLDEQSPFPGVNALYPVVGATLFILGAGGAPGCAAARWLATRPFVAVGRISYSLYLWHWPVVVYLGLVRPGEANILLALLLSVVLASGSYHYVERRYRRTSAIGAGVSQPRVRELQGLMAACMVVCVVVLLARGLPGRVPETAWQLAGATASGEDYGDCEVLAGDVSLQAVRCRLGAPHAAATVALWGDSHANALAPAFDTALHRLGRAGYLYFGSGCRPLLEVARPGRTRCRRFNAAVVDDISAAPDLATVYLAGYWRLPLMGQAYDNAGFLIRDSASRALSPAENRAVFRRGLARTLDALPARRVVMIEDIPEVGSQFGKSVGNHFVRERWRGIRRSGEYMFTRRDDDDYPQAFNSVLSSAFPELEILRLQDVLCSGDQCPLVADGRLLYHDGDHLSEAGSLLLAPVFRRDLESD
ncbi:MAG: acyltransferase family protein [Chromatocurvus sp.]